ncbi:hypothetical protein OG921_20555 [Aldersonia sp. NBC_00410]|uniref:divisome protein SepX/GlpR n=1 Tax=Aldersonia sp. NBC_00410 TaxID=2975954 RepID=UPI00224CA067|nr:gephyrin-like molybdotransferase receptor GlpR [Aldersonia sp. NBC_00410]MCX5045560.1 hypothetical protein [Aldersonia sp. NBC_00410]
MPNSFLWIGLVAMWVFVLFPMLADRHPRIRQTTDATLSIRVLHRGGSRRKPARGPASGHESDPNWQRATRDRRTHSRGIEAEDPMDNHAAETELDHDTEDAGVADTGETETAPPGEIRHGEAVAAETPTEVSAAEDDPSQSDAGPQQPNRSVPVRRGRGGFDPEADAIARAARYRFRQRAVLALLLAAIMSAAVALIATPTVWWVCGASVAMLGGYLSYLRRQVRMEEEIRRRRMARLARARLGVESTTDAELALVPARLRRPGAVVVEVDDEDPAFEHLAHPTVAAHSDLAAEAEMRAASGQ